MSYNITIPVEGLAAHEKYMQKLWFEAGYEKGYAVGLLTGTWTWDYMAWMTNALYHAAVSLVIVYILPRLIGVALQDKLR